MSTRDELTARFKAFLDKNYPCCGVPGCSGEEEEANALVDMAYELLAAPQLVRDISDRVGKRYAHLHQMRQDALQAQAWDEGDLHGANFPHRKRGFKYDDNPYRKPA